MSDWLRMEEGNDWEYVYLAKPGERLNTNGMACARTQGVKLRVGAMVRVRFPDGSEGEYPIATQSRTATYGDHGHNHTVRSERYGVHVDALGFSDLWISLTELDVDADSLEAATVRR